MASGKRGEYMGWDKGDIDCDVGLGLNMQFHPLQQQQRGRVRKIITDEHGSVSLPCPSGMAFTADQRQELERQTIIYKYMMASMPVPPQLLIPLSKHTTAGGGGGGSGRGGGGGGGGDPEPWRCRRTDGKKWRCSRDVAPDQKYCERHSHKGRPSSRSRKPVESLLSPQSAPAPAPTPPPATSSACNSMEFIPSPLVQYNLLPTPSYGYRYPHEPLMKKDALTAAPPLCQQRASIGGGETSLHEDQINSRPFIDAWSLADTDPSCSICTSTTNTATGHPTPTGATSSPSPIHSILPLTLSVSSGIQIDDHHDIPDVTVTGHEGQAGTTMRSSSSSSQPLNWMTSWINSPPGGPLAEALCLGMSDVGSYGMRNNLEDFVPSPLPYGRSSTSSTGSKDTDEQAFQPH